MAVWGCLAWEVIGFSTSSRGLARSSLRILIPIGPVQILPPRTIFQCCNRLNSWHISPSVSIQHPLEAFVTLKIEAVFLRKEENLIITRCGIKKKKVWLMLALLSVLDIATRYGLGRPGIESRWGARFSPPVPTGPGTHPASYTMGTGSLSWGIKRPGCGIDHPPHLAPKIKKE